MGDPIPFAHDGRVHLFFLSSPPGTQDYPERVATTWQHMASTDLKSWDLLAPALAPGRPGTYDAGGIWTGSVVENAGIFYLYYTAHDPTNRANPQTIALATSRDLVNFERHPDNPILYPPPQFSQVDWRDPYVFFNQVEECWFMLVATRVSEASMVQSRWHGGTLALATSNDLIHWEVETEPLYTPGTTFCPECPELWPFGDKWYLVYSRFSEQAGTVFRVADSPRGPFRTPLREELGGRRWYAAKSAPFEHGRAFFGWIHDRVNTEAGPRWLWGGDFALNRVLRPDESGQWMGVRPVVGDPAFDQFLEVQLGAPGMFGGAVAQAEVPRNTVIKATFEAVDAAAVGIDLVTGETAYRILVDNRRRLVRITQEPQPLDDFWADLTGTGSSYREVDGPALACAKRSPEADSGSATVHVVLEGDLIEVFVDDDVALTQRIRWPGGQVNAFAIDGEAKVSVAIAPD